MKETRSIKKDELRNNWFVIDAAGVRLGKLATKSASLLIGKQKVAQTSNMINGDHVVVINAEKIDIHPRKMKQKKYYRHSGYMGGLTTTPVAEMLETFPERIIEKAVKGMLPKNKLGRAMYKNLYVYKGSEHPHDAQKPEKIQVK